MSAAEVSMGILILSAAAAVMILASTLPALIKALKSGPEKAYRDRYEIVGRCLQCGGNIAWSAVGYLSFNWPLLITAVINVVLLTALILQLMGARRRI
jgi:uncharacterized membrane protein YdfJ with MMPL/SSD domain